MVDDEDHGDVRADPGFQVVALDGSRKGLLAVLLDVACPRLRLHFDDAAGRFKSLSPGLRHNDLDFTINAEIIFADLAKDAGHPMHDRADSIEAFPLRELGGWHCFSHTTLLPLAAGFVLDSISC